jgi:hypothetical protein
LSGALLRNGSEEGSLGAGVPASDPVTLTMLPDRCCCMTRSSCFMLSIVPSTFVSKVVAYLAAARPMPVSAPVIKMTGSVPTAGGHRSQAG